MTFKQTKAYIIFRYEWGVLVIMMWLKLYRISNLNILLCTTISLRQRLILPLSVTPLSSHYWILLQLIPISMKQMRILQLFLWILLLPRCRSNPTTWNSYLNLHLLHQVSSISSWLQSSIHYPLFWSKRERIISLLNMRTTKWIRSYHSINNSRLYLFVSSKSCSEIKTFCYTIYPFLLFYEE